MTAHLAFGAPIESLDVIVVEDSRPMQTLLRSMLVAFGVSRTRTFDGADQALQAMLAEPPTLVIADWRMAPTSGFQLLQAIRRKAMAPLAFVPLVMISAYGTRGAVEAALRAGAHAFLVKPFAPSALFRTIERILADARGFRLEGDAYVIEGVNQRLDALKDGEQALEGARKFHEAVMSMQDPFEDRSDDLVAIPRWPARRKKERASGKPGARRGYGVVTDGEG